MENYNERDLDEFLRNLLQEEYAISLIEYNKKYAKDNDHIIHCYSIIKDRKKDWIASNGAFFSIAVGKKPVVVKFLEQGGFVNDEASSQFEKSAKEANYKLIVKQTKKLKALVTEGFLCNNKISILIFKSYGKFR